MDLVKFFQDQLLHTLNAIEYSISLNPQDNTISPILDEVSKALYPENETIHRYMGTWSRHRLLHHLVTYEKYFALPSVLYWKDNLSEFPNFEETKIGSRNEEKNWTLDNPINQMMDHFIDIRHQQINMISDLSNEILNTPKSTPIWGERTLTWILTKSIQHSFEHGNKMLRHALFLEGSRKWIYNDLKKKTEEGHEINLEYLEILEKRLH